MKLHLMITEAIQNYILKPFPATKQDCKDVKKYHIILTPMILYKFSCTELNVIYSAYQKKFTLF